VNLPFNWLAEQTLTLGMEWNRDELNDPASMQATTTTDALPGISGDPSQRSPKTAPP
jgi:ferric enterobactin receptor